MSIGSSADLIQVQFFRAAVGAARIDPDMEWVPLDNAEVGLTSMLAATLGLGEPIETSTTDNHGRVWFLATDWQQADTLTLKYNGADQVLATIDPDTPYDPVRGFRYGIGMHSYDPELLKEAIATPRPR